MALKKSKSVVAIAAVSSLLLLAACGDDSSSSGPSDKVISESDSEDNDSSSSSSVILSGDSHEESSSSFDSEKSSSSVTQNDSGKSSSSKVTEPAEGSSSSFADECSMLLDGESGWNWNVPKQCHFNSAITYGTMTDSRDKKVYKTVKIGEQTWMAENLNYADSTKTPSLLKSHWCYKHVAANCDVTGLLYTWAAVIDSVKLATDADNPRDCGYGKGCAFQTTVQGICPDGWHLPTKTEWETLLTEVGGISTAGKILKSQTGWNDNGNGTDNVGFSALPAGYRRYDDYFTNAGNYVLFWSVTEIDDYLTYSMSLDYFYENAELDNSEKDFGHPVRCLKD